MGPPEPVAIRSNPVGIKGFRSSSISHWRGESDDAPGSADEVDVLVVVVNFRTPEMTLECLTSLAAEEARPRGIRVVVVDNGSGDGSAERLAATIRERGWSGWGAGGGRGPKTISRN